MSMPSLSKAVQIGVMADKAALVSRQERPAMDPESSMTKMVSNLERKAYLLSVEGATSAEGAVYAGTDGIGIETGDADSGAGPEYGGGGDELFAGLANGL